MDNARNIRKKDSDVAMIRVVATIMIVLCHVSTWLGYSAIGLILDVGVQIFFFISGWCYFDKKIEKSLDWLIERWKKICIPAYIWALVMLVVTYFLGKWETPLWQYILSHGLNLQGWAKIVPGCQLSWVSCIDGCGPMWFLTALMLCYAVMLIVKHFDWRCTSIQSVWLYIVFGVLMVILAAFFGICLEWLYIYFLGYLLKGVWSAISKRQYIVVTICMMLSMAIRLYARMILDGTIWYDNILVYLTHNVLAIWIIATIRLMNQNSGLIKKLLSIRLIQWVDRYQYEVFLVHYGVLYIVSKELNHISIIWQVLIFAAVTMICACLLQRLGNRSRKEVLGNDNKTKF